MDFVKKVMDITVKESLDRGSILFKEGDAAECFYILINGRVGLTMGRENRQVYTSSQTGDSFGWAGLVGMRFHPAKAECLDPTTLLTIRVNDYKHLLDKDLSSGFIFYRNLSETVGNRLLLSYRSLSRSDAEI